MATTTATSAGPTTDWMNNLIPGYSGLVGQASGAIGDLLAGQPSPSTAQNAAATFGVENGLGTGSGVTNRYGYDLYNQMGAQRQQQGMSDLNSLIGSTSSPALSNQAQQMQNTQFGQNLAQQGSEFGQSLQTQVSEFGQNLQEQQFNDYINALIGLSNSGIGGTGGSPSTATAGGGNPFTGLANSVSQFQSYVPSTSSYAYL